MSDSHATGGSLADEVTFLSEWVLPNAAELSARESLLASVSSLVLRIWPRCSIEVFGSAAVDLSLFDSDLDIRVHGDCGRSPVETLGSALMSEPWAGAVRLVKEARVPIVTITEATSNVQADVSFSCLGDGGSATALLAMLMMRYPSFRAVSLVVKLFLAVRGMNKNFHGGLGSFKVYMMVAAMLEQYAGHSIGSDSGAMLLRFFELYGRVSDTSRNRIRKIWVPCTMGEYVCIHDGDWTSAMRDAHALLAQQLCTQSGPWLDGIVDPRHVADLRTAGWCWRPPANDRADIEREGVARACTHNYPSPNAPRKDSVVEQVPCRVYSDRDGESLICTTDRERCIGASPSHTRYADEPEARLRE